MRTATNKNVSAKTDKSVNPIPKKTTSNKVAKPAIEKPKNHVATPSSNPIPSPIKTPNKQSQLITLLKDPKGADIKMLMQATGWQAHSVRGFLSGTIKKKLSLNLISQKQDGLQIYRITSGD